MKPVNVQAENYKFKDQLDDSDLEHGELVHLKWPDGVQEMKQIYLDIQNSDVKAYVLHMVHGTENRIYLRYQPAVLIERCAIFEQ